MHFNGCEKRWWWWKKRVIWAGIKVRASLGNIENKGSSTEACVYVFMIIITTKERVYLLLKLFNVCFLNRLSPTPYC